jgi:hypothetical protein
MSRLRDANGSSLSDAVVQALQFHPNGQLMLTAGFDKRLKLFQVCSQGADQGGAQARQCCMSGVELVSAGNVSGRTSVLQRWVWELYNDNTASAQLLHAHRIFLTSLLPVLCAVG